MSKLLRQGANIKTLQNLQAMWKYNLNTKMVKTSTIILNFDTNCHETSWKNTPAGVADCERKQPRRERKQIGVHRVLLVLQCSATVTVRHKMRGFWEGVYKNGEKKDKAKVERCTRYPHMWNSICLKRTTDQNVKCVQMIRAWNIYNIVVSASGYMTVITHTKMIWQLASLVVNLSSQRSKRSKCHREMRAGFDSQQGCNIGNQI